MALYQLYTLLTTLALAIFSGLLAGFIISLGCFKEPETYYRDEESFEIPEEGYNENDKNIKKCWNHLYRLISLFLKWKLFIYLYIYLFIKIYLLIIFIYLIEHLK